MPSEIRCKTIEQYADGEIVVIDRGPFGDLFAAVRLAHQRCWIPGARSGTGMTILETTFESVP